MDNKTEFRMAISRMNKVGNLTGFYPHKIDGYFLDDNSKKVFSWKNDNKKDISGTYQMPSIKDEHYNNIITMNIKTSLVDFKFVVTTLEMYSYVTGEYIECDMKETIIKNCADI